MTQTRLREFDLAAGQTLTVDCRRIEGPFGWDATATGAAMAVEASNAADPQSASDWFASKTTPTIAAGAAAQDGEEIPIGWIRWVAASGGTGRVRLAFRGRIVPTVR